MEVNVAADCSEVLRAMFSAGCSTLLAGSLTSPLEGRKKARMAGDTVARTCVADVSHKKVQAERLR